MPINSVYVGKITYADAFFASNSLIRFNCFFSWYTQKYSQKYYFCNLQLKKNSCAQLKTFILRFVISCDV